VRGQIDVQREFRPGGFCPSEIVRDWMGMPGAWAVCDDDSCA